MCSSLIWALFVKSLWYNLLNHFLPFQIDQRLSSLPTIHSPLKIATVFILLLCARLILELYLRPLPILCSIMCNSPSLVPTADLPQTLRYHGLTMITVANFCLPYQLSSSTLPFCHHSIISNTDYYIFSQHAHNCHEIIVHVQCVDSITRKKQNNSNRVITQAVTIPLIKISEPTMQFYRIIYCVAMVRIIIISVAFFREKHIRFLIATTSAFSLVS